MSEKIIVISENIRKINFEPMKVFYDFEIFKSFEEIQTDMNEYILAIIDTDTIHKSFEISNKLRDLRPDISLLILNDFQKQSERFFFTKIRGFGQLKIMHVKNNEFTEELLNNIQALTHPEYPAKKSDIAIIIPVYNEESRFQNVLDFMDSLKIMLQKSFINASVFFINDGSTDNTKKLIEKLYSDTSESLDYVYQKPIIAYHNLEINTRKAGTYISGISGIYADILVFVDADNSFKIDDIALLINVVREGYFDIAIGSKDLTSENRTAIRKFISSCKRLLTKPLLPKGVTDSQTGLKVMTSATAKYIIPYLHLEMGLALDLEILYLAKKLDFRVIQIPVMCIDREGSHIDVVKDSIAFLKAIFKIHKLDKKVNIREK